MTDSSNATGRAFFSDGQPRASSRVVGLDGKPATGLARGSSEWWIERLLARMAMRNGRLGMLRDYYRGENETWSLADRAHRDTFGDRFQNLRANLAAPVVEVVEQRMTVGDILIPGDDEGSDRAWSMWTQNSLEARSSEAHLDLLSTGIAHVLVDPWRTVAPGIGEPASSPMSPTMGVARASSVMVRTASEVGELLSDRPAFSSRLARSSSNTLYPSVNSRP